MISWFSESGQIWSSEFYNWPLSLPTDCCAICITTKSLSFISRVWDPPVCRLCPSWWAVAYPARLYSFCCSSTLPFGGEFTSLHCHTTTKHNTDLQNYSYEYSFLVLLFAVANMALASYFCAVLLVHRLVLSQAHLYLKGFIFQTAVSHVGLPRLE